MEHDINQVSQIPHTQNPSWILVRQACSSACYLLGQDLSGSTVLWMKELPCLELVQRFAPPSFQRLHWMPDSCTWLSSVLLLRTTDLCLLATDLCHNLANFPCQLSQCLHCPCPKAYCCHVKEKQLNFEEQILFDKDVFSWITSFIFTGILSGRVMERQEKNHLKSHYFWKG